MASRRSRKPNRYGVGTYGAASDGRHRWRYTTTLASGKTTRKEIKKRELADLDAAVDDFLEQEKRLGYALNVNQRTVEQYCTIWLEQRASVRNEASSVIKYRYDLSLLLPFIGTIKVRQLSPDHIQAAVHALTTRTKADGTPQYRSMTIRGAVRTLHNALEPLVVEGVLPRNPARSKLLDLPKSRTYQPEIATVEELDRLFATVRGEWIEILLHLYAGTGLRRGEALGLRWTDVDLEAKVITPFQAVKLIAGRAVVGRLKTEASLQSVPISGDLTGWLKEQHRRVLVMQVAHGGPAWTKHNLVFPSRTGEPWHPHSMVRTFKRLLVKAGLPRTRTIHGLRHAYGTLLGQHYNAKVVQRLLRHADVATTHRYIHSDSTQERAATETVADELRRRRNNG